MLQQAKDDLAAVENAYYLVSGRTVRLDLQQFWGEVSVSERYIVRSRMLTVLRQL